MKLNFWYIDVFSNQRFKGNPAAVFFDADGLDEKIMAQIANELNLSETVFLLKPTDKTATYKARIFTPKTELPFAGHPTIAASFAYKSFHNFAGDKLIQECGAGLIKIKKDNEIFFVTQKDPDFTELHYGKKEIAEMVALEEKDIADFQIEKISTGIPWAVIMLNSSKAVGNANPNHEKILNFSKKENLVGLQIFAKNDDAKADIHIRTFCPIVGVYEDPACGSGNGCVASYIAKHSILEKSNYIASQGRELGRESAIYASFEKINGKIQNIKIGGGAVKVLEGTINV